MNKRYQVMLNEDVFENISKKTGINSNRQILNEAMLLLEWAVEEAGEGRSIGSVDENRQEYKEVILPSLKAVKRQVEGEKHA